MLVTRQPLDVLLKASNLFFLGRLAWRDVSTSGRPLLRFHRVIPDFMCHLRRMEAASDRRTDVSFDAKDMDQTITCKQVCRSTGWPAGRFR